MISSDHQNEPSTASPQSPVEAAKRNSSHLRGTIAAALASPASHFEGDDVHILKFHGVYQCDDRDVRPDRKKAGLEPDYCFMIRVAIPGGRLTAEQYLALDEFADLCGDGTLRITTRQNIQFHGVYKRHLKELIAGVNSRWMTTLAGCGDVERNVTAPPAPLADPAYALVRELASRLARELRPGTHAYSEIWLDSEKVHSTQNEEPFYGAQYLPRKFKTGVTVAGDNAIDVYSDDCGLVAIVRDGSVVGFNVLAGGGQGMTPTRSDTMATLAQPVGFIRPEHAVEAVCAIASMLRDHGNRQDRKHARVKFLLAEWGLDRFRAEFRRRVTFEVAPPVPLPRPVHRDCFGLHPQGDGRHFFGLFVPSGRIADRDGARLRAALREVVRRYRPGVCLTPDQNILLTDLHGQQAGDEIDRALRVHGVSPALALTPVRRYSVVCPALPRCSLAVTEAERVFARVLAQFEQELEALGLTGEPLTLRMTGCSNGCARPYTADIGLVGRKPGQRYNIYVGGGLAGDRLADLYAEDIPIDELAATLRPLLQEFAQRRQPGEGFSDFYQRRLGRDSPRTVLTGREEQTRAHFPLEGLP